MKAPNASFVEPHTNLDAGHATRFLKLLNPKLTGLTFQTFQDKKSAGGAWLAQIIQLQDRNKLPQLHAHGAGIYVTVNISEGEKYTVSDVKLEGEMFGREDELGQLVTLSNLQSGLEYALLRQGLAITATA